MTTTLKDYYKILGIDRKSTEKEIKAAFRKAARQVHPDLQSQNDKAAAEEKFKEINEACAVLSDPEKRAQYDRLLDYGPGSDGSWGQQPGMDVQEDGQSWNPADMDDINSILESLFGGGETAPFGGRARSSRKKQAGPARGQDISSELRLTLEEAFHGGRKELQLSMAESGSTAMKTLEVNIPAFVRDGSKIRLKGQGSEGRGGGPRGDLLLTVRILPHSRFSLNGDNLETSVKMSPEQAVLGYRLTVPTLDRDVEVAVPPATHNGRKLRLRGKGWAGRDGRRGDLLVSIVIDIPDFLSPAEQELYQRLADMRKKA
jgi:curved DNA-binding protein